MTATTQYKSMSAFAAEHEISRETVSDVLNINKLPYQQVGKAKALPLATQRRILKILGLRPHANRVPA